MKLYHGTKLMSLECKELLCDFPLASKAANGLGFYVTNNIELARLYGNVIEWEVDSTFTCSLMRPIEVQGVKGIEYVLSQREADNMVINALSTAIH